MLSKHANYVDISSSATKNVGISSVVCASLLQLCAVLFGFLIVLENARALAAWICARGPLDQLG